MAAIQSRSFSGLDLLQIMDEDGMDVTPQSLLQQNSFQPKLVTSQWVQSNSDTLGSDLYSKLHVSWLNVLLGAATIITIIDVFQGVPIREVQL